MDNALNLNAVLNSVAGQPMCSTSLLFKDTLKTSEDSSNKGCSLFLCYLDRNGLLFRGLDKRIADSTLVAVALMIAGSKPEEKESMVSLVMNFLE